MRYRHEYDKKLIGKNLRTARERRHLSVESVRGYLQLGSVQAIYKYEAGESFPPADTLLALMELYDIDRRDLICEQLTQCEGLQKYPDWDLFVDRGWTHRIQISIRQIGSLARERAQAISQYCDACLCK